MLLPLRQANEAIVFPSLGVTVHILSVEDGVVHLGIEAPPDVKVLPAELVDKGAAGEQPTGHDPRQEGLEVFALSDAAPREAGDGAAWFPKSVSPSHLWEAMQKEFASGPKAN